MFEINIIIIIIDNSVIFGDFRFSSNNMFKSSCNSGFFNSGIYFEFICFDFLVYIGVFCFCSFVFGFLCGFLNRGRLVLNFVRSIQEFDYVRVINVGIDNIEEGDGEVEVVE